MYEGLTEPIDLTDVRNELSLDRDDQREDDFLMTAITACRDRLEGVLPYYLAERTVTLACPLHGESIVEARLKGPVLAIEDVRLRLLDKSYIDVPMTCVDLTAGLLRVAVEAALMDYPDRRECGPCRCPLPPATALEISYRAGANVPPVIKAALLRMVRNYYSDRTSDPLTDEVMRMISTERRWSVR